MFSQKKIIKPERVKITFLTFFLSVLGYIVYLYILSLNENEVDYYGLIIFVSWLGIFLGIYIIITWYKVTGSFFSLYIIFLFFFYLFNFGQFLMWAIGIHVPTELGKVPLYPGYNVPSSLEILKVQSYTLLCILMFHCGAILYQLQKYKFELKIKKNKVTSIIKENKIALKAVFYSSLLLSIIVIPITLYINISNLQISSNYGYTALYYSEFANTGATIQGLFSRMFFPVLLGLLIGSKFNKKIRFFVYIIFIINSLLILLTGARGSWIYQFFILAWLSHTFYKSINLKLVFRYFLIFFIVLYITDFIVSIRDVGLQNIENINIFSFFTDSLIIKAFFEMGGSIKPTMILMEYGSEIWPYGNTYLLAIQGMISNQFIYIFNTPFQLLSDWFSHDLLNLTYGAGFSLIAENILNFGPFFSPLVMVVIGFVISSLIYVDKNMNYKNYPFRILFAAATLNFLINWIRNELHIQLKDWFYGVIIFFIIIYIIKIILSTFNRKD